jgi:hypothetical protein
MSLEHPDSTRQYTCLACEDTVTEFHAKCPSCGGTAFQTASDATTKSKSALQRVADRTAPINPYIPR